MLIVDGTLVPKRDHSVAEQSKNHRYSTNHEVVIDADTRLVVGVGWPVTGNRKDCKAWELSGAKAAVGRTTVIADGGYRGTGLVIPHRRERGQAELPAGKRNTTLPAQSPRPRRARLRPHEELEDLPRLPSEGRRRPPRDARHRPHAQPHPCRIGEQGW
ncbi:MULTISPECIES: transposase [Streptomyces]|uniref:transposase n=1 Tax=Streptomyces TaxID=1883 RepID=UPI001F527F69|nr:MULTISPECIES: transposase [Streptomyces]